LALPTTQIEGIEVSRLTLGSNPLFGYSHKSVAMDTWLKRWVKQGVISKAWLGTGEEAVTVGCIGQFCGARLDIGMKLFEHRLGALVTVRVESVSPLTLFGHVETVVSPTASGRGCSPCLRSESR
jgi:hypothetical protein